MTAVIDTWKVAVVQRCIQEEEPVSWDEVSLAEIAALAVLDWKPVSPHAQPYVEALLRCPTLAMMYGAEEAGYIVPYFLNNARTWKGPVARAVKAELNKRYQEWMDAGRPTSTPPAT